MNGRAIIAGASKVRKWVVLVSLVCATLVAMLPMAQPAAAGFGGWTTGGPVDDIGTVAVAPSDNNVVYGLGNTGVWRTHNGGSSWSRMGTAAISKYAPLAVSSTNHNTLYSGTTEGIVKSTNGGVTWSVVLAGVSVRSLAIHPTNGSIVYAGTSSPGNHAHIHKTTDGGAHWSAITETITSNPIPPVVEDIAINPAEPSNVIAIVLTYHGGHLRRTTNGGGTWTFQRLVGTTPLYLPGSLAVAPLRDAVRVYAGYQAAGSKTVARSDRPDAPWVGLTPSLPATGSGVAGIVVPDNDHDWVVAAFAGTAAAPGGVFLSTDRGATWRDKDLGQNPQSLAWAARSNTLFVGTPNGVYQYTMIVPAGPATMGYRSPGS